MYQIILLTHDKQWWNVTKYIYLSTNLEYLYLSISLFSCVILLLHYIFGANTFYSTTFI